MCFRPSVKKQTCAQISCTARTLSFLHVYTTSTGWNWGISVSLWSGIKESVFVDGCCLCPKKIKSFYRPHFELSQLKAQNKMSYRKCACKQSWCLCDSFRTRRIEWLKCTPGQKQRTFWQLDHLDSSLNSSQAILKSSCSNPLSAVQDVIGRISSLWGERGGSFGQDLVVTKQEATRSS